MDVAASRRNPASKKGNKENAPPAHGSKSFIKGDKTTVAPFRLKNNEKLAKSEPLKAKGKKADTGSVSAEAQKPVPAAALSSRNALGLYKGKIVQSKIGSIWKSNTNVDMADQKPPGPKLENQRIGNVARRRSKSAAEIPKPSRQKPMPVRSKSVSDRPAQVSKPAASSRPPAGFYSARPPARSVPATLTTAGSRSTTVAPTKASGTQNPEPKVSGTDRKVYKPPVTSTISQYRVTMESTEERRAKLAEWLASKGKALKRPAMTMANPSKTKVSVKVDCKLQSQPAARHIPEAGPEVQQADSAAAAAPCADTQEAELAAPSQTPGIMNTTLDLLENSDDLLVESQDSVDDIVVNLCDALEAMATPSRYTDEFTQVKAEGGDDDMDGSKPMDECQERLKNGMPEGVEQMKDEAEGSNEHKVEMDKKVESDDDDDDDGGGVMENNSQMEDASVIKYSVKTTPYLQSVKKTIEGEVSTSTSRRKSNIKDLKFLTPVRRSCRIQRKSTHLPKMLVDHDPCVSSLAELVKLDDDPNAYIYRKNTALTVDLPDEASL